MGPPWVGKSLAEELDTPNSITPEFPMPCWLALNSLRKTYLKCSKNEREYCKLQLLFEKTLHKLIFRKSIDEMF